MSTNQELINHYASKPGQNGPVSDIAGAISFLTYQAFAAGVKRGREVPIEVDETTSYDDGQVWSNWLDKEGTEYIGKSGAPV